MRADKSPLDSFLDWKLELRTEGGDFCEDTLKVGH